MGSRGTQRPQNMCGACQYTWYPRGKDLSLKCQRCGSSDVQIVPVKSSGLGGCLVVLVGAAFLILVIVGIFSKKDETSPALTRAESNTTSESTQQIETPSPPQALPTSPSEDEGQRGVGPAAGPGTSAGTATRSFATSFDCYVATARDELTICSDPGLAAMDVELAAAYRAALSSAGANMDALRVAQRAWLSERSECGDDLRCLRRIYGERLGQFRGSMSSTAPDTSGPRLVEKP